MDQLARKKHWENIYQTKEFENLSWYEPVPETSLNFLKQSNIQKDAKIIDIGGGDSYFADNLLRQGYTDITVLDISENALQKAKKRLGPDASKIKWIVADAATFKPAEKYHFWHDRAAFHFLTEEEEINHYIQTVQESIEPEGIFVLGTFSKEGPEKCSGISIKQYSESEMTNRLKKYFQKVKCISMEHHTPSGKIQSFIFCSFKKILV